MKNIVDGYVDGDCGKGNDDQTCFNKGTCTIQLEIEGQTYLYSGKCYHSGIGSLCACVENN
jgi:hypothetical protein